MTMVADTAFKIHIMGLMRVVAEFRLCSFFDHFLIIAVTFYASCLCIVSGIFINIIRMTVQTIRSSSAMAVVKKSRVPPGCEKRRKFAHPVFCGVHCRVTGKADLALLVGLVTGKAIFHQFGRFFQVHSVNSFTQRLGRPGCFVAAGAEGCILHFIILMAFR